MPKVNCAKTVAKRHGINPAEVKDLAAQIKAGLDAGEPPERLALRMKQNAEYEGYVKAAQAALDVYTQERMLTEIQGSSRADVAEALIGMGHGIEGAISDSAMGRAHSHAQSLRGQLMNQLQKAGPEVVMAHNRNLEPKEVMKAMYAIRKGEPLEGISDVTRARAEAYVDLQRYIVNEMNKMGAFISELDDYISRQSWDPEKLGMQKGESWEDAFQRWWNSVSQHIDAQRSFGVDDLTVLTEGPQAEAFMQRMRDIYDGLTTGMHRKSGVDVDPQDAKRVRQQISKAIGDIKEQDIEPNQTVTIQKPDGTTVELNARKMLSDTKKTNDVLRRLRLCMKGKI